MYSGVNLIRELMKIKSKKGLDVFRVRRENGDKEIPEITQVVTIGFKSWGISAPFLSF